MTNVQRTLAAAGVLLAVGVGFSQTRHGSEFLAQLRSTLEKAVPNSVSNDASGQPNVTLALKGISSSSSARQFAMINSLILSVGETGYVRTDEGLVKVKCLQISENGVVIAVGDEGKRQDLHLVQPR